MCGRGGGRCAVGSAAGSATAERCGASRGWEQAKQQLNEVEDVWNELLKLAENGLKHAKRRVKKRSKKGEKG